MALTDFKFRTTLPASDIERAKKFYEEKLGLKQLEDTPGGVAYETGSGTSVFVFPSPKAGSNPNTYGGWGVSDIEAEVKALKAKGITFEEYDTPDYKTVDGIATMPGGKIKAAWFKDSEGNILALTQMG